MLSLIRCNLYSLHFFSQDWVERASHRRVCNGQQNLWKTNVSSVAASLTDMIISIKRR